jgi:NADPH2:quinone reductase
MVGATSGVGSFAVQLSRLRGAHGIATVRPGDEGFVTDLGAVETVDYTGDTMREVRQRFPDGLDA